MENSSVFHLPYLRFLGRCEQSAARTAEALPLFWAGSGLELYFTGSELHLLLEADFLGFEPWIVVEMNHAPLLRMPLNQGEQDICLFRSMTPGVPKHVRILKDTQPIADDPAHRLWVRGLRWRDGDFLPLPKPDCRLEFIGDSLTSGEGVVGARQEEDWVPPLFSASQSWAKQCADLMGAEFRLISQSGWGVRSGWDNHPGHTLPSIYDRVCGPAQGLANQTMGAQKLHQFETWQPDAIVINLGTNDAGAMGNPPWHGPEGQAFQQTGDKAGRTLFEDSAVHFLKNLRRYNPSAKLVWVYGMIDGPLAPVLESAVARFRRETGNQDAYYLSLPAATDETMGSRRHPGPLCHQAAAKTTAEFLKTILYPDRTAGAAAPTRQNN